MRQHYYKIMKLLFKTSELELAQIGFRGDSNDNKSVLELKEMNNPQRNANQKSKFNKSNATKTVAFMLNQQESKKKIDPEHVKYEEMLNYQKGLVALNYQYIL